MLNIIVMVQHLCANNTFDKRKTSMVHKMYTVAAKRLENERNENEYNRHTLYAGMYENEEKRKINR